MGCDVSDRDSEPSRIRFQLPKKFFDDCNGVEQASVPRKLRSAMKKRGRESILPPLANSKRPNCGRGSPLPNSTDSNYESSSNGAQHHKKEGLKKSKLKLKQGRPECYPGDSISESITKDEEEVVETLYALAGMFPNSDTPRRSTVDGKRSETNPSNLLEGGQNSVPPSEDKKVDMNPYCPSKSVDVAEHAPDKEKTFAVAENLETHKEQRQLPISKLVRSSLQTVSPLPNNGPTDEKPLINPINSEAPSRICFGAGRLKWPEQQDTSLSETKPEFQVALATDAGSQVEWQHSIKECTKRELWPVLSTASTNVLRTQSPPPRASDAKFPAWLDNTLCTYRPKLASNGSSVKKEMSYEAEGKPWKRCKTHVYISQLIQALRTSERKEKLQLQPSQERLDEESKHGMLMQTNFSGLQDSVSAPSITAGAADRKATEFGSSVVHHSRLKDQYPVDLVFGHNTSQKQGPKLFSLSSEDSEVDNNFYINKSRSVQETSSQFQVPYFNSFVQHQAFRPTTMPQNGYASAAFPDILFTAQERQQVLQADLKLPPYLGSPFGDQHQMTPIASMRHHQKQQQQRLWATQLAAHCRLSMGAAQVPSWQHARQDAPVGVPCSQSVFPLSHKSVEMINTKYGPVSQQNQKFMLVPSSPLPPGMMKRLDNHLPSLYEENGNGMCSSSAPPLQLLCNERL